MRELDLKELEDDAFLQGSEAGAALKEPFVKHLFLDHKLSKFESLLREKSLKRMISYEDLQKSLGDDQLRKLLQKDAANSAFHRDLSNSRLDQGDDSALQQQSSHLYNQFLNKRAAGPNSYADVEELVSMLQSKRNTEAKPGDAAHRVFTLGHVHSLGNIFAAESKQAITAKADPGMKSAPQRSPKAEDAVLVDARAADQSKITDERHDHF